MVAVRISVTMIRYSLMIPFCWLTGGGDHLRVTEVELISVVTSPSGGTLGTGKELKTIITPGYVVGSTNSGIQIIQHSQNVDCRQVI